MCDYITKSKLGLDITIDFTNWNLNYGFFLKGKSGHSSITLKIILDLILIERS